MLLAQLDDNKEKVIKDDASAVAAQSLTRYKERRNPTCNECVELSHKWCQNENTVLSTPLC